MLNTIAMINSSYRRRLTTFPPSNQKLRTAEHKNEMFVKDVRGVPLFLPQGKQPQ
jgi:hypothetical protein